MSRLYFLCFIFLVSCSQQASIELSSNTGYIRILIIRHGEKQVGNPTGVADLYPNNIGFMHSWALVPYFEKIAPTINAIYAAPHGIDNEHSYRPTEICGPTAASRGITINANEPSNLIGVTQTSSLVQNILANAKPGQTILVCWEHTNIPAIAQALGLKLLPWYDVDFSGIWDVHVYPNGAADIRQDIEDLPSSFTIPVTAFSDVPVTAFQSDFPLLYQQLLNFCPVSQTNSAQRQCNLDWSSTIRCCDDFLYQKNTQPAPDTSTCTVTKDECLTWYGQPGSV